MLVGSTSMALEVMRAALATTVSLNLLFRQVNVISLHRPLHLPSLRLPLSGEPRVFPLMSLTGETVVGTRSQLMEICHRMDATSMGSHVAL